MNINKVQSEMQRVISTTLLNDVKDKSLKSVTVTSCELTRDLSFCKVYYTVLGEKKLNVSASLEKSKGFLKSNIAKKMKLRKIPELIFVFDESIEYGNRISELLNDLK